jgi:tRNA(Ile)-lysidine synthase
MFEPMQTPPNPKLAADSQRLDRLAASLKLAVGEDWQKRRYGVAVSGGPDSMALTWLMANVLPENMAAATVDHGFRTSAADEARMVAGYCAHEHIDHQILRPPTPITGSLQAAARAERYRLLELWRQDQQLDFVLTAHHADDQLETILMRLNRSSGVAGLAGVRRRNGTVVRPLLNWRRAELLSIALEQDIPFIDDPSNADHRFDRARLRHALTGQNLIDAEAVSRSAGHLADAEDALEWSVDQALASWPAPHSPFTIRDEGYPDEIFRRIIIRRLRHFQPELDIRAATLDTLISGMRSRTRVMVGDLLIDPVPMEDAIWRISFAPRRNGHKNP